MTSEQRPATDQLFYIDYEGANNDEAYSLKELTFQLFFDEVLKYNHSCEILDGHQCACGHRFNFYDMLITALKKKEYHDRERIKAMLAKTPKMKFVSTKDVMCSKCGKDTSVTAKYHYPNNMD